MHLPSEKARDFAEEICDFVRHGLTRSDTIHEIAELFDEVNGELVQSVETVMHDADHHDGMAGPGCLTQLKHILSNYEPLHLADDAQADLFSVGAELKKAL